MSSLIYYLNRSIYNDPVCVCVCTRINVQIEVTVNIRPGNLSKVMIFTVAPDTARTRES